MGGRGDQWGRAVSNGRAFRRQLTDLLGPLDGARVPGGCDHCDAYQVPAPVSDGVWRISVYHDPDCPVLASTGDAADAS